MWSSLYVGYQVFVLAYFALLNLQYAAFTYLGLRSIVVTAREFSQVALTDFVEHQIYEPVSILVPAYNEQESIVASVDSFLSLNFPEFEVIVVSDGSTDQTIGRLIHAFDLVEHERIRRRIVPTGYVRRVFRSLRHPGLHVIEKDWGGKADALNAGLNLAHYPLICPVDGDSMLDAEANLRSSRLFTEDDTLLAIGGTVRPLNAVATTEGAIEEMRLPRRWIERFQVLEYARAFFTGRAGWSHVGMLLIISGAFGMFKREAVERVGGFLVGTVGEDAELVLRLHKHYRRAGAPYRIAFTPDPICWTEVPSDLGSLRRQRTDGSVGCWRRCGSTRTCCSTRGTAGSGFSRYRGS